MLDHDGSDTLLFNFSQRGVLHAVRFAYPGVSARTIAAHKVQPHPRHVTVGKRLKEHGVVVVALGTRLHPARRVLQCGVGCHIRIH